MTKLPERSGDELTNFDWKISSINNNAAENIPASGHKALRSSSDEGDSTAQASCNSADCGFNLYDSDRPVRAIVQAGPQESWKVSGTRGCSLSDTHCKTVASLIPVSAQHIADGVWPISIDELAASKVNSSFVLSSLPNGDISGALNSILEKCPSSGCIIEIPARDGRLFASAPLLIRNHSNVTIHCDSSSPISATFQNTAKGPDGFYLGLLEVQYSDNVNVDGCHFDSGSMNNVGLNLVHWFASSNGSFTRGIVTSSGVRGLNHLLGVRVEGIPARPADSNQISMSSISAPYIAVSHGAYANHNAFHDLTLTNSYQCFDFNGSAENRIGQTSKWNKFSENTCKGSGDGTGQSDGFSFIESATETLVENNVFDMAGTLYNHCIYNCGGPVPATIQGNKFRRCVGHLGCIFIFQNANKTLVQGNTFESPSHDAIRYDTPSGVPIQTTISKNIFSQVGTSFVAASVSASALTSNLITMNAINSYSVDDLVLIASSSHMPFLNGQMVRISAVTTRGFSFRFVHPDIDASSDVVIIENGFCAFRYVSSARQGPVTVTITGNSYTGGNLVCGDERFAMFYSTIVGNSGLLFFLGAPPVSSVIGPNLDSGSSVTRKPPRFLDR